ncbi:MAG: LAGLIDADG family homing endonuclease [Candidatus Omnitrophica bacterium]|nr:LAGLIDADG family homing endonuclease [Candidatus Omnitrophota bacterium]
MASENARCADNQQASSGIISDEYLTGFTEGEGCFYVGFSKRNDLPLGWQVITEFHLSQNPGGKNILEAFQKRLGCGYLKLNHPKSEKDKTWVLIIKDRKDLQEKLIPFFKKHSLYSQKAEEYLVFKQVLDTIKLKEHLNLNGFKKIVDLVFQLPRNTKKRYSKENILSAASETIRQRSERIKI